MPFKTAQSKYLRRETSDNLADTRKKSYLNR